MQTDVGEAYDAIAEEYDTFYRDGDSVQQDRLIAADIATLRRPHDVTIDLGCGTGLIPRLTRVPSDEYLGVDVSPEMMRVAKRLLPKHNFIVSDVVDLPLNHPLTLGAFDFAVSTFGPFNYVPDRGKMVTALTLMLKPTGRFYLGLYGDGHPGSRALHGSDLPMPQYLTWTESDISKVFDAAPVTYGYWRMGPFWMVWGEKNV